MEAKVFYAPGTEAEAPLTSKRMMTRSDVILGTGKRDELRIDHYEKVVVVRPLSEGEICAIFDQVGGIGVDRDGFPDTSSLGFTGHLGLLRLIARGGLVEPELSLEEIEAMPFGIPGEIARRILELSGLHQDAREVVRSFRQEPGSPGAEVPDELGNDPEDGAG